MVGVPLVADVVEPAEMRAVACRHSVPRGGGEQATELRLPPQALLSTLAPDPLPHKRKGNPLSRSGLFSPQGARAGSPNGRVKGAIIRVAPQAAAR
jgi:hypothetical protein